MRFELTTSTLARLRSTPELRPHASARRDMADIPGPCKREICAALALFGRSERIRTSGPCLPKTVLYQAELHSVPCPPIISAAQLRKGVRASCGKELA